MWVWGWIFENGRGCGGFLVVIPGDGIFGLAVLGDEVRDRPMCRDFQLDDFCGFCGRGLVFVWREIGWILNFVAE